MAFFSDFQYGFRFFVQLYVIELLGNFNRSGATRAVALDISKAFDSIRHAGLLHNLSLMEFQVRYLMSFLLLGNKWLQVILGGKSSQEYPVNAWVSEGSIVGPSLFLLYINDLPGDVICDIAIYAYIMSIAKTASKKIGALIHSMKFLFPKVALYLYKSTICPCMEYCCHIWAAAPSCYLDLDCWSFTCYFSWTFGSSTKWRQLKSFLEVLF